MVVNVAATDTFVFGLRIAYTDAQISLFEIGKDIGLTN